MSERIRLQLYRGIKLRKAFCVQESQTPETKAITVISIIIIKISEVTKRAQVHITTREVKRPFLNPLTAMHRYEVLSTSFS